jgi:lysophosphatidic acid acyltransferase/lysophosphatidylinositol acyltransferase
MLSFRGFKKNIIPQLILSYTFLASGLIINFLELFIYLFIRPFNLMLYKKINYYLTLAIWGSKKNLIL